MKFLDNWQEEKRSAYLYRLMAEYESNILHKKLFSELAIAAEKQACLWEEKIFSHGLHPPHFTPDLRTRIVSKLVKWLGAENMHGILSVMKIRGMAIFPRYHSEHRHTSLNAVSNLRAAIFGINDGLISNAGLIVGFVGASANEHFIILAGITGILAGACSMGAGEYISVRTQREVFEYQITIEKQELEEYPEEEAQELSLIYQTRGLPLSEANKLANFMIQNPEIGLDTLAREELGLKPDDLVSPIGAMLSSFFSFALGASIPLIPFAIGLHAWNLYVSISLTGLTLFLTGSALSLFTNRHPVFLGLRMLAIGCGAGTLTFLIGKIIGTHLS